MSYYNKCKESFFRPGGFNLTQRALEKCAFKKGALVADIGCGTGESAELISELFHVSVICVEPSLSMSGGDNTIINATAEATTIDNNILDGALMECVLSLCENINDAINEMNRVIKPGGYLIISDVYSKTSTKKTFGVMKWLYEINTITNELERNGFSPIFFEDHSREIAKMAARLIMEEKENELCESLLGEHKNIGYFLLIAKKN